MRRFALLLTGLATLQGSGPLLFGDDQGFKHQHGRLPS